MYLWTKIAVLHNEKLLYLHWFRFRDQFNSMKLKTLHSSHREVRKSVPAANLLNFLLSTKCPYRDVAVSR